MRTQVLGPWGTSLQMLEKCCRHLAIFSALCFHTSSLSWSLLLLFRKMFPVQIWVSFQSVSNGVISTLLSPLPISICFSFVISSFLFSLLCCISFGPHLTFELFSHRLKISSGWILVHSGVGLITSHQVGEAFANLSPGALPCYIREWYEIINRCLEANVMGTCSW